LLPELPMFFFGGGFKGNFLPGYLGHCLRPPMRHFHILFFLFKRTGP
jgi:hypothetical protein